MQIRDLFQDDITRPITQVIKVDDLGQEEILQELREYVVTPQIEQELLRFLEPFVASRRGIASPVEHIGVWIAGFFGSGKSHFAKMLGYLLSNTTLTVNEQPIQAIDLFLKRVEVAKSSRSTEIRAALTQLRNFFAARPLMFQIKSHEDQLNKSNESISVIMYRQYLTMLGFSSDPWIGRLELTLQQRGRLDQFKEAILREEGMPWEEVRQDFAVARPSIVRAMIAAMPETYRNEDQANRAFDDIRTGLRMTPDDLARELAAYAAAQEAQLPERSFKLVYIIDEMGQFVGDDGQRLLELQTIGEDFATYGKGRLWLIVTAQEQIEDVIAGVRERRADFNRIKERFRIQLRMTSENIERVLQERILSKRPTASAALQPLFQQYAGQISDIGRPESHRQLPVLDVSQFERAYPFFPYHFRLMQDAFAHLRAKGGSSIQLTGAERSMIGVAQGVLKSPYNQFASASTGRLVRLDEIYDQIENEVGSSDRRAMSGAAEMPERDGVAPVRVLKALFLMMQVEWLPRTLDNIARVVAPRVDCDFNRHRAAVKLVLDDLKAARYVNEVDGLYRYLSMAERGIEEEIANEQIKHNAVLRKAREVLADVLSGIGNLNYENGLATFKIRLLGDGEEFNTVGAISLEVFSPVAVEYDTELSLESIRDLRSPGDTRTVYWLPGDITSPTEEVKRLLRLTAVVSKRKGSEASDEERRIVREKETEADLLKNRLQAIFRRALLSGTIIYDGNPSILDGRTDNLNAIFNRELSKVVPHVYTQFHLAAVSVTEKKIGEMLTVRPESLANVEPQLHLWDKQGRINTHAPIVVPVLEELQRRGQYAQPTDGKALAELFADVPFGWDPLVFRLVLAALFRAGTIGVTIAQRYYSDPGEAVAREALTSKAAFNRAVFDYDPSGGLSLEERKQARQTLAALFNAQVTDTTNDLAHALREAANDLQRRNDVLRAQISGNGLPAPDVLFESRNLLQPFLDPQKKPDAAVKALLANVGAITRFCQTQEQTEQFFKAGYASRFVQLRDVANAVAQAQTQVGALDTEAVRRALEDWRSLEQSRTIVSRWSDAQSVGQTLLDVYQQTYRSLFAERTRTYEVVRDQVAPFGPVPGDITSRILPLSNDWALNGLTLAGVAATLTDLQYDIQLAPIRQTDAIKQLQDNQQHQTVAPAGTEDEHKALQETRPVFIQASSVLAGEIADETELQARIDAFAERVRAELKRGRKVVIG